MKKIEEILIRDINMRMKRKLGKGKKQLSALEDKKDEITNSEIRCCSSPMLPARSPASCSPSAVPRPRGKGVGVCVGRGKGGVRLAIS